MSQCKKFAPNIFHKTKCTNCFRQKEEHSAEALECNRASRSIARSGYLFVAPDWDFSVPLNRTKRWQRRWFVLYDDGELNYSVDEHPDTIPQGSVDMSKVLEVTGAEQVTGHPHSLALTSPDRVTFVKAASREDARWWAELLAVFPRRHKRNATFPGGRASPSLPQLGRSASPQPPRPRHLSCSGPSPRTNFETPPLKEERESPPKDEQLKQTINSTRPGWLPEPTGNVTIDTSKPIRNNDYLISSGSPPTRDKLRCDDKARARRDWRNERLRDIATALTDRSPESSLALPAESLLHLKKGWLWLKNFDDAEFVRRWIVLSGPTLNIYQEQDESCTPEIIVELSSVTSYNEVPTDSKYGFDIKWSGPTLILSAVTSGIRSNWLQALKKAAPISDTKITTPISIRSVLLSSDEEYRTASEGGGRCGSEDWADLPPSPTPQNGKTLNRVKERVRMRPKLPRCQSRQSTLDSTSTDELDCVKLPIMEFSNNETESQLAKAVEEIRGLEEEIARLKKFQADAVIQEKKAKEMMSTFERTEKELNQRNSQAEIKFLKEQKALQRKLIELEETTKIYEEKLNNLTKELQTKQHKLYNLQEELTNTNERLTNNLEENERLFKRIKELEQKYNLINKNKNKLHIDSLTDLTNIDLDLDIEELGQNELKEYCLDLRGRFEKAVMEIRAVKRELRESHEKCDGLELKNYNLLGTIQINKNDYQAEINLLISRLEHLTAKLNAAEKQIRIKMKSDAKDKRRSLSLKGRESFSISKEVEDKVSELEAKIQSIEKGRLNKRRYYKRERSSERSSPIDDKSLRRLRRKSLDSATSTSEPMKLIMRLTSLEKKISTSNESLNIDLNNDLSPVKVKLNECLYQLNLLRGSLSKRSPGYERVQLLEQYFNELMEILDDDCKINEICVINSSSSAVVKQLQNLLIEKLNSLNEKKETLKMNNKLDRNAKLEILAEKLAYENILISRIQEALLIKPTTDEAICERLIDKEMKETVNLINSLKNKLEGKPEKYVNKTNVDYLSKVLTKCLLTATNSLESYKNYLLTNGPNLNYLFSEQKKLNSLLNQYKTTKLPQLAEMLAFETVNLNNDKATCLRDETISEFSKTTREIVNNELIQTEINHVLLRAAQIYQENLDADHVYFFSFFAAERAALELWSDLVGNCLNDEINNNITELTELYENNLNKLQRQNWRRRVESERNQINKTSNNLLNEYADIVAHKALIDARINVFNGKLNDCLDNSNETRNNFLNCIDNDRNWDCFNQLSSLSASVQMKNQSLELEFNLMFNKYSKECYALIEQPELKQILGYLNDLTDEISELQKYAQVPVDYDDIVVRNWSDVCLKCKCLRDKLEEVRMTLVRASPRFKRLDDPRPIYLGTEYLGQVENLRAAYRGALASAAANKDHHQEAEIEQLRMLCERVLVAIEQWHRRTIQEMRELHSKEMEQLKEEKEQALAEETQATLAALDAMRKAHEAEVQREVAKFKQDFARHQRDDLFDLSERLSVKCLEAAALEDQLGSATRQLTHAQQHILKLERNPQLSPLQN